MDAARANGLMETVRSLGFTAGPVVGGALGAAGLLGPALALNALSFAVVGFAALALRARRRPAAADGGDAPVRARDGFAFLAHERDLAIALGGAVAALALFSISVTAEPFFVTDVLDAGTARLRRDADLVDARHGRRLGGARPPRAARIARRRRARRRRRSRAPGSPARRSHRSCGWR